ncbi:uncharacterized protein PV09_00952 [Verruconis gallopava]|uniref:Myb-like domain-containing protein n=1 Tax=Verruconis gallopava TaxID=253628 RepID=A0A0D1XZ23_9PEZI|nr:uncharacterized protein PV09_00952 [Verruconis gallopava]KIW08006.1 hypothetical protein PV09_00952 [Verruconis gallopava]
MARSRKTTPSAQATEPLSTAPAGYPTRSRVEAGDQTNPPPGTQRVTTRRSARAKSVESNESSESRSSKILQREDAPQSISQIDLTTVEEESDNEDEDLDIPPPDEVADLGATAGDEDDDVVGERSLHSMSGTTAQDQLSEDEDENLNPHLLLAHSPAVYRAAIDLIKRFDQHKPILLQILKGIDRADSSTAISFRKDVEALQDAVEQLGEAFGHRLSLFSPDHVMERLFKQSLPHMTSECWRLTELIQLLNLAVISKELAGTPIETEVLAENLRQLDAQFPFPFIKDLNMSEDSPHVVGNSYLQTETFEVALAIRLQVTVMEIQLKFEADGFNATEFIQEMFYAVPGSHDNLRAWDVNGLGSGELGLLPEFEKKIRRRIKRLLNALEEDAHEIADGSDEGLQILTRNFPWTEFRAAVLRWAKLRMEEITSSIDGAGGIEKLMDDIRTELSKDNTFDANASVPSRRSPVKQKAKISTSEAPRSSQSLSSPSKLQAEIGEPNAHGHAQDVEAYIDEESSEKAPAVDAELADVLNKFTESQKQRKENIRQTPTSSANPARRRQFVDEQDDAERISQFEDGTQPALDQRPNQSKAISSQPTWKRRHASSDDDVSEDEGLQFDTREIDMSQRRRAAPRLSQSPKRVRITVPDSDVRDERVREYEEQKAIMTSQTRHAMQSRPRTQLGRTRWNAASEMRLEELIAEHGISWAYLKSLDQEGDNLFDGRDQVALKDKARNMKIQFLLNGLNPLPRNWELVPLDKKAVARLLLGNVDIERLLAAGVGLKQLCEAGANVQDLADAGVTKEQLQNTGISQALLDNITFPG